MATDKLNLCYDHNPDAIIIFDIATTMILDCNPVAIEKYAYSKEQLRKLPISALLYDERQVHVLKKEQSEPDNALPIQTHVKQSGEWIKVEINNRCIDYDSTPSILLSIRDITTRQSFKMKLQKQNQLQKAMLKISESSKTSDLNLLFKMIHDQIKSLMPAQNFYIALLENYDQCIYTFPYYTALVGKDEILENSTLELPGSFTDWVTKNESLLLDRYMVNKIISDKTQIDIDVENIGEHAASWMGVQLNGREDIKLGAIVVQDYENPNAYSDSDFNLLKMASETIGSAIEYNRAKLGLEKSEKMFRTLVETASVGLNEIDLDENILYSNKVFARLVGYDHEKEIIGKNLKAFTTPQAFEQMVEKTKTERISGKAGIYETQLISKQGSIIDIIMNSTPVTDDRGNVTKCIVVVTNITEQKQAHRAKIIAQKHAANQEKHALVGQVAGKMAHDFNNILGAIMGNAEISLLDCEDDEIKKTLEIILAQTLRGRNLTKNLVAFAKDQEPKQEFFDINEKINLACSLLKKDLNRIHVITDLSKNLPYLLADPGMIEHALINLIQNAIHATSKIGHAIITIKSYHHDNNIIVEIEDNGCGIPLKHHDSIFTPAFTLKGSNDQSNVYKKNIKGTGYGMSNVKMYIEKHHGNISFTSEENFGTKFVIQLPIMMKGLTTDEISEVKESRIQINKQILIVEDEATISAIQSKVLENPPFHHQIDIAVNGNTALELLSKKTYDLVSLDYILPGNLTGMDIYHEIRLKDKNLPILFISGNLEFIESIKELQHNDKNIDHLSKPSKNKDYAKSINDLLNKTNS